LAGANLIYGAGMIESGVTCDLGQMVIDNDIIAMIRHFVRGVPVSDETMAVDEIVAVGPGGEFMSSEHTLRHLKETSRPRLFDRDVREAWEAGSGSDLAARAAAEVRRILEEHEVPALPDEATAEIAAIVARADSGVGPNGGRS
jgi:trimethylamine--corrinoid protein Co-methyltransferase